MKVTALILSVCVLACGCATPTVILIHQATGQLHECRPSGRYSPTLVGQIVTNQEIDSCVQQYEALGFIRAEKLTPQQRSMLASPQISSQTRSAKLLPTKGPFANYGITLEAEYVDAGTGSGAAQILYPNNLVLRGNYSTIDQGQTTKLMLIGPESVAAYQATSDTARGVAVFNGTDGTVLECVYAVSRTTGSGAGICQDNRGNQYRLLF